MNEKKEENLNHNVDKMTINLLENKNSMDDLLENVFFFSSKFKKKKYDLIVLKHHTGILTKIQMNKFNHPFNFKQA